MTEDLWSGVPFAAMLAAVFTINPGVAVLLSIGTLATFAILSLVGAYASRQHV